MKFISLLAFAFLLSCSTPRPVQGEVPYPEAGYVEFILDVNELGKPMNAKITNSFPIGKFEKLAMDTIYKWTFKVKIVNAQPVVQNGIRYTMDFKPQNL